MSKLHEIVSKLRVWGIPGIRAYVKRELHWFAVARRLRRISRLDAGATPERGITLIGDFLNGASNSKTNRDFAYALKDAGIPFQTFSTDPFTAIPTTDYSEILTSPAEFRLHRYSHVIEMFRSPLPRELVKQRARVAFWEGEHGILDVWPFLGGDDPIIAMSDFNAEYFRCELRAPVFKILYPVRRIDVAMPSPIEMRRRFGIGESDFFVFFNFDFGSYKRKNPLAAIRAFAKAFPVERDVRLVFKTMGAKSHQAELAEVMLEAKSQNVADRFSVITEYLPHSDLYGLVNACDAYMSLHRGEGFGMGMAEAMLMGKPVIATNWSANTEFCHPGASFLVPYRLVPIKSDEYFISMKEWAEADVSAAADALRRCYCDRAMAAAVGAKGKAFVEGHFSLANFKKSVEAFLDGRMGGGFHEG